MGLLYLGNSTFRKHFYDRVIYPCKNPEKFHPDHLPLQRTFAIYGQKGNQKQQAVAQLLEEAEIPYLTLPVTFSMTLNFCDEFDRLVNEFKNNKHHMYVVIIDHADILVHEPDDKSVTQITTQLAKYAMDANLFIIALFDRQRGEPNAYKDAFFSQFPYVSVLSSPATDKTFIAAFYKQKFNSFCNEYKISNTLQEEEYQMLADASVYATVDDLTKFCQAIYFELVQTESVALSFEEHVEKRLKNTGGIVHIDTMVYQMAKMVDEQFTSLIGIMPAVAPKRREKRQRIEEEEIKEEVKVEVKEEEDKPVKM